MKTRYIPDVFPFSEYGYRSGRYGYAFDQVRQSGSRKHLDVGCYDGNWADKLRVLGIREIYGIDVNREAIEEGLKKTVCITLLHVLVMASLPFEPDCFDSCSLLDVYEHLSLTDQDTVLKEIFRILRPGGIFIITVPKKHLFSFLDLGNLKFVMPGLHRRYCERKMGKESYRKRYLSSPSGLVGDISGTKRWHEHFSEARLRSALIREGFQINDADGSGLFMRPMAMLRSTIRFKPVKAALERVELFDMKRFDSANLYITCCKPCANARIS